MTDKTKADGSEAESTSQKRPQEDIKPPPRRSEPPTFFGWIRQTARLWGSLVFVALILVLFRKVILPFVLALIVAYVLAPLIRRINEHTIAGRQVPRFVAVVVVYVCLLGLLGLFFTSFVPILSEEFSKIQRKAPALIDQVRDQWVPGLASWIQSTFGSVKKTPPKTSLSKPRAEAGIVRAKIQQGEVVLDLRKLKLELSKGTDGKWLLQTPQSKRPPLEGSERFVDVINQHIKDFGSRSLDVINRVVGVGRKFLLGVLNTITTFILVLMISAFLLIDMERIIRWFRNLVPQRYFLDFDNVIALIDKGLSGAIRGQLIICMINGVFTWIGLIIFGVDYHILLALLAAVMSLIPIFGSILSSIPIVLIALVSGDGGLDIFKGALVLAWIIGIHLVEANLLNPKIMGTAAKIHPVIVIFAVVAGERTYGPIGALLGVPLVSAVQAVFVYLRLKVRGELDADLTPPTS